MSTAVTSSRVEGELKLQRPTAALIGWMPPAEAAQWVAGQGQTVTDDHRRIVEQAHASVAQRATSVDTSDPLTEVPGILAEHVAALRTNNVSAVFFREGWDVRTQTTDLNEI
jgi:hypothetical protein